MRPACPHDRLVVELHQIRRDEDGRRWHPCVCRDCGLHTEVERCSGYGRPVYRFDEPGGTTFRRIER